MAPRSEDSSMPMHIGQTIVSGLMEVKEKVGELSGKVEGLHASVSELNTRVSHTVTREEFTSTIASVASKKPSNGKGYPAVAAALQSEKKESWWTLAHQRIGVLIGIVMLLTLFSGAALWMANAYMTLEAAKAAIAKQDGGN